jgi:hypothetical protein
MTVISGAALPLCPIRCLEASHTLTRGILQRCDSQGTPGCVCHSSEDSILTSSKPKMQTSSVETSQESGGTVQDGRDLRFCDHYTCAGVCVQ